MSRKKTVREWLEEDDLCVQECLEDCVTDLYPVERITREEYEFAKHACTETNEGLEACLEECYEGW